MVILATDTPASSAVDASASGAATSTLPEEPPKPLYRVLDGVEVSSTDEVNPYPIGAMIENLPVVRPQPGLSFASVVYEALAEGGATRFLAVYAGAGPEQMNKLGPVRSARPYYLEWWAEYNGFYAHAGGSPDALQMVREFGYHDLNGIGGEHQYFWRDRGIAAPHNLFTSHELLADAIHDRQYEKNNLPIQPWRFKDDRPLAERPASGQFVRVNFSGLAFQTEWRYDQSTNTYLRFNAGQIHTDALTGEQLRAKNVIVQMIPPIRGVGEKGRLTLDVNGTGKAYVFVDGGMNIGTWKKESRSGRTVFFYENGKEVELSRGATWISVLPETQTVEYGTPAS